MVVSVQIAPPDFDRMFGALADHTRRRSEEHTSELQSQSNLVCRLLLEKKKKFPQLTRSRIRKEKTRMTLAYAHSLYALQYSYSVRNKRVGSAYDPRWPSIRVYKITDQ